MLSPDCQRAGLVTAGAPYSSALRGAPAALPSHSFGSVSGFEKRDQVTARGGDPMPENSDTGKQSAALFFKFSLLCSDFSQVN